jgi:hypothetical protein
VTSIVVVQVNRFLQQQGMRKEEVEREMERAYEQYFSSLARKVRSNSFPIFLIRKPSRKPFSMKTYSQLLCNTFFIPSPPVADQICSKYIIWKLFVDQIESQQRFRRKTVKYDLFVGTVPS